jgi:pSer/pThr/pTyr-binding forkhead associated (FHA) protein
MISRPPREVGVAERAVRRRRCAGDGIARVARPVRGPVVARPDALSACAGVDVDILRAPSSHATMLGRDRCDGMGPSARQPILGSWQSGLRIRLVTVDGDPAQPFVVLHEGRFSRHYLAEITSEGGQSVARFVWKVQNDTHTPRGKAGVTLSNRDIDDVWQREIDSHLQLDLPQIVARFPAPDGLLASPPIVHCKQVDAYFHPVCAGTGAVLAVCRDDEFLAGCGLVPYSTDTWRYLHGGDAARGSHVFYRVGGANSERPRAGVTVHTGNQLFRDWAALVHAGADDPAAAAAKSALPCLTCDHRQTCFPSLSAATEVPAEQHLRFVSFYDVRSLALERLDFGYGELCNLLGGGEPADVLAASAVPGRQQALQTAVTALSGPGQWLFAGDATRFPLEVLRAKLAAFREVVVGLAAVHTTLGRPHFAVAPTNVMAAWTGAGTGTPRRWGFRTALIDLGSPVRVMPPAAARTDLGEQLGPGPELREDLPMLPFIAADLQGIDGQSVTLPVSCRATKGDDGAVELSIAAQGSTNLKHYRAGDLVAVTAAAGADGNEASTEVWAQLREIKSRSLTAVARLPADHPGAAWHDRRFEARLAFHRHFGPPVDLYGLGMLLFRTLLVNDEQSMEEIAEAAGKCRRRLGDELTGVVDEPHVTMRLQQLITGKELRSRFDASQVLQQSDARKVMVAAAGKGAPALDAGLWQQLLSIAFRLTTQWQGYSYSHSYAEASPFVLRQVLTDVDAVCQRVHVDLFARAEQDAAIATACHELLGQLRTELMAAEAPETTRAGMAKPAGAAPKGFRLLVEHESAAVPPQDYAFDREQVTIGRREVENLIRLNDPMVSSAHAVIEQQAEGWVVVDRNSTNGTEVDGIRLPGDVPQPLVDGTVILIRPFRLTFTTAAANLDSTSVLHTISADKLAQQLQAAYARSSTAPTGELQAALRRVLTEARDMVGGPELMARLEDLTRRFRGADGEGGAADAAQLQARFFTSAHKSLSQLSRAMIGPGEFQKPEEVQAFAGKLGRFVETTTQWIERTLELRRALGKHLELGATSTSIGRPLVRSAADVRQLLLAWSEAGAAADPSGYFLAKFYDDVIAIFEGLLAGSQQVRRAIRERLEPTRLVDLAGRGIINNAAAGSALWKLYVQTFQEVTEGKQFELELDRLLQKSLQDHRSGR